DSRADRAEPPGRGRAVWGGLGRTEGGAREAPRGWAQATPAGPYPPGHWARKLAEARRLGYIREGQLLEEEGKKRFEGEWKARAQPHHPPGNQSSTRQADAAPADDTPPKPTATAADLKAANATI